MSGTTQQPLLVGASGLLPTNSNLLQPLSGYYRLFDALWLLMMSLASTSSATTQLSADTGAADVMIENQIALLQQQIDTLHARLSNAGIS